MASNVPTTMNALVAQEGHTVGIVDRPVPAIADDQILIKVTAVALNPTDHKLIDSIAPVGSILGHDLSGIVVRVGGRVTTFAVGDHVTTFVHGAATTENGAFAEYARVAEDLAWKVSPGTLTHEQAAATNVALWTAVQALYHPKRLGLVEPPAKVSGEEWLLIYGGSTAVGLSAVELAHLSGYKVVSTASPRNFDLVKAHGADVVLDYNDPAVLSKIKAATGDSIGKALDAVALQDTQKLCAEAIRPSGGTVLLLLPPASDVTSRKDVDIRATMLYTALGREFSIGPMTIPAVPEDRAHMVGWIQKFPRLFEEGKLTPLPVKLWPGGLSAISDGLQYMRAGKVSGEKIVYVI